MLGMKLLIYTGIFLVCSAIGLIKSQKYTWRVEELKEFKNALNMFENKIKFTYEDIPTVFKDISKKINGNVGNIFKNASEKMQNMQAGEAWEYALENTYTSLKKADIDIIKGLGRMLGKTDLSGQISEIKLVNNFIDAQIEDAKQEKDKNYKMYKTLGIVVGATIVIILA